MMWIPNIPLPTPLREITTDADPSSLSLSVHPHHTHTHTDTHDTLLTYTHTVNDAISVLLKIPSLYIRPGLPPQDLAPCLALLGLAPQCLALLSSALKGFALLGPALPCLAPSGLALPRLAPAGLSQGIDSAFAHKCKSSQQPFLFVGGFNEFHQTRSNW